MKRFLWFLAFIMVLLFLINSGSRLQWDTSAGKAQSQTLKRIEASNAVLIDAATGKVLFEKNGAEKCYPASTTKILTALVAIENASLDDSVVVGEEANLAALDSSKAGLVYGESLSMEQLLNSMLVPSGNDAAYTIAAYVGRKLKPGRLSNREAVQLFVEEMNKRAGELGAKSSHFSNPDGYHSEDHYTTANDMALIAREAMKHESIRNIVSMAEYRLPDVLQTSSAGSAFEARIFLNTNRLIIPGDDHYMSCCTGIKTGHTGEAGYCLMASAAKEGKEVIAVVMHSTESKVWDDAATLLKIGFEQP